MCMCVYIYIHVYIYTYIYIQVGLASLLIASKHEELAPQNVANLVVRSGGTSEEVLEMEYIYMYVCIYVI